MVLTPNTKQHLRRHLLYLNNIFPVGHVLPLRTKQIQ